MGSLDGVLSTQAVWIDSHEVVEVRFRASELSFERLLEHAIANSCDQRVFATSKDQLEIATKRLGSKAERFDGKVRRAKDDDQLFYLGRSPLRFVPLTPLQARLVNAALAPAAVKRKSDPLAALSPRQRAMAAAIRTVLAKDEHACDGLLRPAELDQLDEYTVALRRRLTQ